MWPDSQDNDKFLEIQKVSSVSSMYLMLVVDSTMVPWLCTWKFMLLARKDWPSMWHIVHSMANRVESAEERQETLARRRECYWGTSHHYWICWFSTAKLGQLPYHAPSQEKVLSQHQIRQNSAKLHYRITVQWQRTRVGCNATHVKLINFLLILFINYIVFL